jgi:hypothetical protein
MSVVEQYITFWNTDGEDQRQLASTIFDEGVRYYAPVGLLTGAQELIDFRTQFVEHMKDAKLVTRQEPETLHDRARVKWEIRLADGKAFAAGSDVLVIADGKINSVTSFLDQAPEGFDPAHHHD